MHEALNGIFHRRDASYTEVLQTSSGRGLTDSGPVMPEQLKGWSSGLLGRLHTKHSEKGDILEACSIQEFGAPEVCPRISKAFAEKLAD